MFVFSFLNTKVTALFFTSSKNYQSSTCFTISISLDTTVRISSVSNLFEISDLTETDDASFS